MSVEAVAVPGSRAPIQVDRRAIGVLSFCHGCIDLASGAVPALLPFLILERGYSYAQASALLLAITIASSFLQPLFGHLADTRPMPWLMPSGLILSGLAISVVGIANAYWLVFVLVALAGIGSAAFHPEAARYTKYVSGSFRAKGMSLFQVGGNTGFAFGPILVTPLIIVFGLKGTVWLLVPFAVFAALLIWAMPYLGGFIPRATGDPKRGADAHEGTDQWGPFWLLAVVSALRTGIYYGMQAFIPAYFILRFAASAGEANLALTLLLISGAVGTLVAGWLGDRLGLKRILLICFAVLPPLIGLVLVAGQGLGYALVGLVGFFTVGTFSPSIVIGQQLVPNRIGIASGVTLGASFGFGGAIAAALGPIADSAGLETAILIVALLPIPTLLLTLPIPGGPSLWSAGRARVGQRG